ncbi:MAG: hypothetical protein KDE19_12140, partial [Caldilineaceae bacterium]|nr:hypothetical protein [Caldilineaceae bacterium]
MKITDITVQSFRYMSNTVRDSEGHGHPGPEHEARSTMLTIHTDEGVKGYSFGPMPKGTLEGAIKPLLIGEDPNYREKIWHAMKERQRLNLATLNDKHLNTIDLALW